ncbi:MAG: D-Ala-D-Ala carboxypeptidase family metallohydrolase [Dictyoglomus sp.]|nr:D-Ala-D-Ala carboxypeptidase family metallohydrolase [Dictyoglomus sp.]MDW8188323.1 D-Ala-D-Ala carboxypeptidase family metallohydrolase [Dictyoglomus sp.]
MFEINEVKVSKNFYLKDFQCRCCKRVMIHPLLLDKLEKLYQLSKGNFKITSGYRCESHNKKIGGVLNSKHTKGCACDITSENIKEIFEIIKSLGFSFIKLDEKKNYIHVEV